MSKIAQCSMDGIPEARERKARSYRVQRYRVQFIKEKDDIERTQISTKNDAAEFARKYLGDLPAEKMVVIALDASNKITGFLCFEGVANQCAAYPSSIFAFLLSACAAAFIVAHNHPGESTSPSEADWSITRKLMTAAKVLDLGFHDHLIIAGEKTVHLRDSSKWPN